MNKDAERGTGVGCVLTCVQTHMVGIIKRLRGACTVYIISLITIPCSNYNASGTHSTLRSLLTYNLYTASVVNHTHTQTSKKKNLVSSSSYLSFENPICSLYSPYSCHSSFLHPLSALLRLVLTKMSGKQYWKMRQAHLKSENRYL